MGRSVFAVVLALAVAVFRPCLAEGPVNDGPEAEIARLCTPKAPLFQIPAACNTSRLSSYDPIYAVYQGAHDDERSIRLHYSMRYLLFMPDCLANYGAALNEEARTGGLDSSEKAAIARNAVDCIKGFDQRHEFFLAYTGEFDFYWNTRNSSPVVNRINNPGAHYRRHINSYGERSIRFRWIDLSLEHRSNGQSTDPSIRVTDASSQDFGRYRTQVEYEKGNHAYLDSISQSTNFAAAQALFQIGDGLNLWTRVKLFYFANNTAITWGPMADQNVQMWDYDRLTLAAAYRIGGEKTSRSDERRLFADWTLGAKGLATDSFNFGLYWPVRVGGVPVPLFARLHYGPLNTLSDFAKEQTSFGVGLLLLQ